MTELSRRHKNNHNAMRNAAIGALLGVIGVCALFLVIALPLRALQEHPVDNAVATPLLTPTVPATPSPSR